MFAPATPVRAALLWLLTAVLMVGSCGCTAGAPTEEAGTEAPTPDPGMFPGAPMGV